MQRQNKKLINIISKSFASKWKPNMPEHRFIIDKDSYRFPHPVWNLKDAEKVEISHYQPKTIRDKIAYFTMKIMRTSFDKITGYKPGQMSESLYIRRVIFLETIAGVPGFIGGMLRHLGSLRSLREDGGWIHHLLEEAENERMHLLTFLHLRQPGMFMRSLIMMSQFFFISGYGLVYLISPTTAHRFVGYLEEEAVKTYTQIIKDMDDGNLPLWEDLAAPQEAIKYWGLEENAKFRDVIVSIRADEVSHREYNHHFADIPKDAPIAGHKLEVIKEKKI
jgi:demethoxyubiquinone hydroxylase (CLK1/Coq7/Cat5 family)